MTSPSLTTPLHNASDRQLTLSSDDLIRQLKLSQQIPRLVQELSGQRIIVAAAKENGIRVSDAELQAAADDFRKRQKLHTADQTWQWLQQHFLAIEDLETILHQQLLTDKLAQHLFGDQIEPHFAKSYSEQVEAQLYEIEVDSENLALELFYSLQAGETNFASLASEYSLNSRLRRRGGYRGWLKRAELPPELAQPIFALQPPALLKPIPFAKEQSTTWHLLRVEQIRSPELTPQHYQKIRNQLFQDWLSQQISQVKVALG